MAYNRKRKELSWADLVSRPAVVEEGATSVAIPASAGADSNSLYSIDNIISDVLSDKLKLRKVNNSGDSIPAVNDTVVQEQQLQAAPELNGEPRVVDNKIAIEYPERQTPVQELLANYLPDVKSEQVKRILQQPEGTQGILSALMPAGDRNAARSDLNVLNSYAPQQEEGRFARDAFSTIGVGGDSAYPPAPLPYGAPGTENFARPNINDVSEMNNNQQQNSSGGNIFSRISDWARNNDVGNRITDYALGLSMGSTPSESAALGAQNLYRGNIGRNEARAAEQEAVQAQQQQNQTAQYIQGLGYDEGQTSLIMSNKDLFNKVLTNRLTPQDQDALADVKREQLQLQNEKLRQDISARQVTPSTLANLPSPPAGYRYQFDVNTGEPVLAAIAGGPAAQAEEAARVADENNRQAAEDRYSVVSNAANDARTIVERSPSAVGSYATPFLEKVPGSDAANLKATVQTLKAVSSFDQLQRMRAASKTGAALGSVSDVEIGLLSSAIGSLDTSQSRDQFLRNLDRVQAIFASVVDGNNLYIENPETGKVVSVPAKEATSLINSGGRVVGNGSAPSQQSQYRN